MGWTFPHSTEHRPFLLQHKEDSSPTASNWDKPPTGNSKDLSTDTLGKRRRAWEIPGGLAPCLSPSHLPSLVCPCGRCLTGEAQLWQLRGLALKCDLVGGRGWNKMVLKAPSKPSHSHSVVSTRSILEDLS